eukprot:gb/GEZN01009017.1/.p1 GENE.gb/GEZN01009017.1/~~gb/GEZN01009017.1/.p1  ORF type:complete len:333 (+),score=26.17 gb/GEZN01009017.1/:282-1280(+)
MFLRISGRFFDTLVQEVISGSAMTWHRTFLAGSTIQSRLNNMTAQCDSAGLLNFFGGRPGGKKDKEAWIWTDVSRKGGVLRAFFKKVRDGEINFSESLQEGRWALISPYIAKWYELWNEANTDKTWNEVDAKKWEEEARQLFHYLTSPSIQIADARLGVSLFPGPAPDSVVKDSSGTIVGKKNLEGKTVPILRRDISGQAAFTQDFITPYIHLVCYHVARYLAANILRLGSCQSLELLNNLQGGSYFRHNNRHHKQWIEQILNSHYRARVLIAAGVTWSRHKYECPMCFKPYTYYGSFVKHKNGNACPGNVVADMTRTVLQLFPVLPVEIAE